MTYDKKQLKINKLFRKTAVRDESNDDLEAEVKLLESQLVEKQNELFQLQRNSYRRKAMPVKPFNENENYMRPQKIILKNSVETQKKNLDLMSMLTGMEVQSYVANDHCCIVYHMQHDSQQVIKHGLRIEMQSVSGTNEISKSSMPLGFNLKAVLEDFDNVMMPDCLSAIRKALVAYYDRQQQYEALKKFLNMEAQLFKVIDGSHIEISFVVKSEVEEDDEPVNIVVMLDYRVYDTRAKIISFKEIDLPEGAAEALKEQCVVFKRKPLQAAFEEAFIEGVGPYKICQQTGPRPSQPRRRKRRRANDYNRHDDDTFRPDDCSDPSDDDGED